MGLKLNNDGAKSDFNKLWLIQRKVVKNELEKLESKLTGDVDPKFADLAEIVTADEVCHELNEVTDDYWDHLLGEVGQQWQW